MILVDDGQQEQFQIERPNLPRSSSSIVTSTSPHSQNLAKGKTNVRAVIFLLLMAVGNWTTSYYFQYLFNQHASGIHSREGLFHVKTGIEKNALVFMSVMENNIFIN